MQELRRGKQNADIYSICFDMKGTWLACSSDRSTIHIFNVTAKSDQQTAIKLSDEEAKIDDQGTETESKNKKSGLRFLKGISSYFDGEWSFGKFKVPNDDNSENQICAFSQDGTHVIVVSS